MAGPYVLEPTTNRKIIDYTRLHNSEVWKGKLSVEQYTERDYYLSLAEICQPGMIDAQDIKDGIQGMVVFVLRDTSIVKGDGDDGLTYNIVSSVELLIRKSLRVEYDELLKSVVETNVNSGCIGGVFTIKKHRGKKIAFEMIKLLNKWSLENLGVKSFNFLYSEVGEYYSRLGYKSYHIPLVEIPFNSHSQIREDSAQNDKINFHGYESFDKLINKSLIKIKYDIVQKVKQDHKTRVTLLPQSTIFDWFHLRAKLLGNYSFNHTPNIFGLSIQDSITNELQGYLIWTYDFSDDHIIILKIDLFKNHLKALQKLFIELYKYLNLNYQGYDLKSIHIWESELFNDLTTEDKLSLQNWLIENFHAEFDLKNDSLSALLMFDGSDDVIWENNCKWCWF